MSNQLKATHPNILLITTDQQRYDTIAAAGFPHARTPNLDRLVREGVLFSNCFTPSPACVPARASLCTGVYPKKHGVLDNNSWPASDAHTWPRLLTEAGYTTRAIGKMHFHPCDFPGGFQSRIIAEDKCIDSHDHYRLWIEQQRGKPRPFPWRDTESLRRFKDGCGAVVFEYDEDDHVDAFIGRAAIDSLASAAANAEKQPFCYWVSFNNPHLPFDPPARLLHLFEDRNVPGPIRREGELASKPPWIPAHNARCESVLSSQPVAAMTDEQFLERRRYYDACVTFVDEWIGRILAELERSGLYENTVIIFTSDHGEANGDHYLVEKMLFYENCVRIPLILHCPARWKPHVIDELVSLVDIMPTILDLAGCSVPEHVDGTTLTGLAEGSASLPRDAVFSQFDCHGRRTMIRTHDWKLVLAEEDPSCELYDLRHDPQEFDNRFGSEACKQTQHHLTARLKTFLADAKPLYTKFNTANSDHYYGLARQAESETEA